MATDIKNDATLSTNLISVWFSDSASITTDLHTGSNDLTNNGSATTATGLQGDAVQLTAASSQYMSKTDPGSWNLDIAGDMSIAGWFYLDSAITSTMDIFARDDGQPNRNYMFRFLESGGDQAVYYNSSAGTNATTTGQKLVATGTLSTSTWYHVAWLFDASAGQIEIYLNASSQGTNNGLNTSVYTGGSSTLKIGGTNYYNGRINQLCVWDKVLTSGEVTDLYNSGDGLPYEAAVVNAVKSINGLSNVS